MSYAELDSIRAQGIDAIVNLCGEYSDLHEIEEQSGFEVYFLPTPDEDVPEMQQMEKALEWLDEAVYLGKKVLIHCRHGIGRTGTFITAYLLRRGLGLKLAGKKLKNSRATPTNYSQWRLLKKYGKKSGTLSIKEPSLEQNQAMDLSDFFAEYEDLVRDLEETIAAYEKESRPLPRCGRDNATCCHRYFELKIIEAAYLTSHMNRVLKAAERKGAVNRAMGLSQRIRQLVREREDHGTNAASQKAIQAIYKACGFMCPLNVNGLCILYEYRPIRCRLASIPPTLIDRDLIEDVLSNISGNLFFALSGTFPGKDDLLFSCADTVSGRFAQIYFHHLSSL